MDAFVVQSWMKKVVGRCQALLPGLYEQFFVFIIVSSSRRAWHLARYAKNNIGKTIAMLRLSMPPGDPGILLTQKPG